LHADQVRRSSAVTLTLLPMLASAAVAAQPAASVVPGDPARCPPRAAEPLLTPPGLTPTIDECRQDPCDARCAPDPAVGAPDPQDEVQVDEVEVDDPRPIYLDGGGSGWVFRGGFGHYFWPAGG
jgi:hypothetical protein